MISKLINEDKMHNYVNPSRVRIWSLSDNFTVFHYICHYYCIIVDICFYVL